VVTTQEAPVAPEAAAAEAAVAEAATEAAVVAEAATEPAVVTEPATEATAAAKAAVATKATVAEAAVAEAVASPGRRGDVHGADYSRYGRRRRGVGRRGGTEKHCAGHRACADCAGGDPAGRRE
jgi:hypothetical protein